MWTQLPAMFTRRTWTQTSPGPAGVSSRYYKNFGHARQRIPGIEVAWLTLLTCLFIGAGIEWKRLVRIAKGEDEWRVPSNTTKQVSSTNNGLSFSDK